jgi:hypothetical protein
MKEDYVNLRNWVVGDVEPSYIQNPIFWDSDQMMVVNKSGAIGKAILCLLNNKKPNDFYLDRTVGLGKDILDSQLHHIFPKGKYGNRFNNEINSVFNFTFLSPESNNFIKDKTTKEYINEVVNQRRIPMDGFKTILNLHLINDDSFESLLNEDYKNFLFQRSHMFKKILETEYGLKFSEASVGEEDIDLDENFELENE